MKIGLLGGSFDPVHNGHIAIAEIVFNELNLDEVWFLPSGNHPQKKSVASINQRIKLLQKLLSKYPHFKLSKEDLTKNNFSYTINLIRRLKKKHPADKFYFIIGSDNAKNLTSWHEYKKIPEETQMVVLDRPRTDLQELKKLSFYSKLKFIKIKPIDISSSEIRDKLKNNESISGMIPTSIEKDVIKIYGK